MKRCWGPDPKQHLRACRKARPRCRWRRALSPTRRVCECPAYHFPHRSGSGACRLGVPSDLR